MCYEYWGATEWYFQTLSQKDQSIICDTNTLKLTVSYTTQTSTYVINKIRYKREITYKCQKETERQIEREDLESHRQNDRQKDILRDIPRGIFTVTCLKIQIALYAQDKYNWRGVETKNDYFILNQGTAAPYQWAEENMMMYDIETLFRSSTVPHRLLLKTIAGSCVIFSGKVS